MKTGETGDIRRIFAEGTAIDQALGRAVRDALRRHKRAGHPVAEWRDGRVVWVEPEEIPWGDQAEGPDKPS
jgi:hypothetical protein